MILKGKAQGGASKLAKHLCRTDENERVRILGIEGLNAETIPEAMRELDDLGAAAATRRPLYHGIIAPRNDEPMTPEQRQEAVRRMAKELGLEGQPHIIVGHLKPGEAEHFHIVWSRIDQERQAGISDSHNYRKHEKLARDLEQDFRLQPTRGVHLRDKARQARPERTPEHWEMQQQKRTGQNIDQVREAVTQAWRTTRTGAELVDALSQAGLMVARGDRRDFVLVDDAGGVHSLARRIEGVKVRDVRQRMAGVDVDELETVNAARRRQRLLMETAAAEQGKGGREVMSAVERLRLEELEAERQAKGTTRPRLNQADREISAAVRMLEQLGTQTNVVGRPVALHKAEPARGPELGGTRVAGPSPEAIQRPSVEVKNRNPVPSPVQWPDEKDFTPLWGQGQQRQQQQAAPAVPAPPGKRPSFILDLEAKQRAKGQQLRDLLPKKQQQQEQDQERGLGLELEL